MVVVRIMPIMGNFSSPPLKHKHNVADVNGVSVSSTEINYLSGVTSNVQTQINEIKTTGNKISVVLKGVPGMTYTISNSKETFSGTIPATGSSLVYVNYIDVYTIVSKLGSATYTIKYTIEYIGVHIVKIYKITTFANDSFAVISAASKDGLLSSYYAIGDTKEVVLNGNIGSLDTSLKFSNTKVYMQILDFDHNMDLEMNGEHHMICGFGGSALSGGLDVCFTDTYYTNSTSGEHLIMNTSASNAGGWSKSRMKTVICPAFQNVLPSDLKAVLRSRTIYTDNTGSSNNNNASAVTATTDTVYIPSEFEILGSRTYSNLYEQVYQRQLTYYKNNDVRVRYLYSNPSLGSPIYWWLRSAAYNNSTNFCIIDTGGDTNTTNAYVSYGFMPLITI